jgi:hypothetical protein
MTISPTKVYYPYHPLLVRMRFLGALLASIMFLPLTSMVGADNLPPRIVQVSGPMNGTIENPLIIGITALDPEGDNVTCSWYVDGEPVGYGPDLTYFLLPGHRNVTVVISDLEGGTTQRSWTFSAIPPPGWSDEPDNGRNRFIFWTIFGLSSLVLMMILGTILFRKR